VALSAAARRLERREVQAPRIVDPVVKALVAALAALDDVRERLETALHAANHHPGELELVEERLFALRAASRKYDVPVDALNSLAARYTADLGLVEASVDRLVAAEAAAAELDRRYRAAASALSERRKVAAAKLEQSVNAELAPLRLERARFFAEIVSEPAAAGAHGSDRVEFRVRTNPGTQPGALMQVASGGELARFLLALKVALADRGSAPTLVFDEVDAGVGGAVADAIGARLTRLSRRVQVIAVTHSPQVAARADRHYLISKRALDQGNRVATRVVEVDAAKRREEIARMLAGAQITAEARAAAGRLMQTA
jgi:DNA repair protein RecN (Recombination protein N)